jgi:hypothetical protein
MMDSSKEVSGSDWEQTLRSVIRETEAAELELGLHSNDAGGRKETGSFYTPADVADHVWDQFFRIHQISGAEDLRAFINQTHLVEPSAGSGIFVFTLLRKALQIGLRTEELQAINYSIVDLNFAALRFVRQQIGRLESDLELKLEGFRLAQVDFLGWIQTQSFTRVAFVGNPPFVTNPKGSRWRNVFADFVDAMLDATAEEKTVGLILPMSICFSRDYHQLRQKIFEANNGISAASYDNIPDCLFKSGKPESNNSNKANSQRCTVLMLGGTDACRREATPLIRWSVRERAQMLGTPPRFESFGHYMFDSQIPRPSCSGLMKYLERSNGSRALGDFLDASVDPTFNVAAVARNFIGIREPARRDAASIPISGRTEADTMVALQILASPLFYEYWRSLGDGFHVTRELINKFPVADRVYRVCVARVAETLALWSRRESFVREKLNSGKRVRSYYFPSNFNYLAAELNALA